MSKQNKSVGRRRSRSLAGFAAKDLCETIPKSLTPSDRLLMLLEQSFQYALSNVQKEIMPKDLDISTFRQKGTECWEKIRTTIEEKNLVKLSVSENGIPSESFAISNGEYEEAMSVLQTESDKWSDQVSFYRESLKKTIDCPYIVDTSIWKDHKQLYNYCDIMESTSSTREKLSQQVASLYKHKELFTECLHVSNAVHHNLRFRCEKYFKQNTQDSPRTLMKKMTFSKRKNIKPYSVYKKNE